MFLRFGPGNQLAGLRAGNKPRTGNGAGEELGHVVRAGGAHVVERVDDHLRVFRPLHVDLVQRAPNRFVILGACPGDELVRLGAGRKLRLGRHLTEEGHGRRGGERLERVDRCRPSGLLGGRRGRDFFHELPDGVVVGGASPNDQLLRVGADGNPRLRNRGLQNRHRRGRAHALDGVDLRFRGRGRVALAVDLFQDPGDHLVMRRAGPSGQLLRVGGVGREGGPGYGRLQDWHRAGGRDRLQRVDDDLLCLFRRRLARELIDQVGDLFLDLGRRPGDDLIGLGAAGKPCVGNGAGQEAQRVGGRRRAHPLQRIDHRPGIFGVGRLHVDVFQRRPDHLVVFRAGPGDELVCTGAGRNLGLGNGQAKHLHRTGGVDRFQGVDDGARGQFGRSLGRHPFECLGNRGVVRLPPPGQNRPGRGVHREAHVGQELLEHLDRHFRRRFGNRVDDQLPLELARLAALDRLQRRLDLGVLLGAGPGHQPARLLVDDEVRVREQTLKHGQRALGIDRLEPIDTQPELLALGRLALDLLQHAGNHHVLARLGPNGQLVGLFVGNHLNAGQLFGQRRHQRLKPFLVGRRDRVHHQLPRLQRRGARFVLLDRRPDDLVVGRRGHGHHSVVFHVQRDLCLRRQLLKHGGQVLRRFFHEWMETEQGRVGAGDGRLQPLQRRLDRRLVGWDGQRHQAVALRVDVQSRVRRQACKQRQRGSRIGLRQPIHFQLRRRFGRITVAPHALDRLADHGKLFRRAPGNQLPVLRVDRQSGTRHQQLQCREKRRRTGDHVGPVDRKCLEPRLILHRAGARDLLDRGLDRRMLPGPSPRQQTLAGGIQHEFHVRIELLYHRQHGGRIGRRDRVDHQLLRLLRRRAGVVLLDRRPDDLVVRWRRHGHHLLALRVERELGLGREPLQDRDQAVRRLFRQGIETQRRRIGARLFRLEPFQRRLDGCLVGGRCQGDNAVALRVDAQARIGH